MKVFWVASIAFVVVNAMPGYAETPKADQAAIERSRELADAVMKRIASKDDRSALELMRTQFPVDKFKFNEARDKTLAERRELDGRFGVVTGVKFVREERVSDFLLRFTYVEKREFHLIRWQFTFYRAKDVWRLNSYNWDDNIPELFEGEKAK